MKLFSGKKTRQTYKKKDNLDSALEQSLIEKAKSDKEWALRQALKRFNLTEEVSDPIAEKKREIKSKLYGKVFEEIENRPELAEQFEELVLNEIFDQVRSKRSRPRGEEYEPTSSISQALAEVESLTELKERLQELGILEGGGGFFKGLNLKELLPLISTVMGRIPQEETKAIRTYVVPLNGRWQELGEVEFRRLLSEGKLQLETPKTEQQPPEKVELAKPTEIPEWLKGLNPEVVESWLGMEPADFVIQLKSEVDQGNQESRFIWDFLTTADYEGMVKYIAPYKDNPQFGELVGRILSDDGRDWVVHVLELMQS